MERSREAHVPGNLLIRRRLDRLSNRLHRSLQTMSDNTPDTFKVLLEKLVKTPEYFTPDDLKVALNHLFTPDAAHPAQIGSFLTALHIERIERRPDSLAVAAKVLRERAVKADVANDHDFIVDIVGTGGDGHDTFNVSTTAAIVAAGAGARVIKVRPYTSPKFINELTDTSDISTVVGLRHLSPAQQIFCNLWDAYSRNQITVPPFQFQTYPLLSSWPHISTLP